MSDAIVVGYDRKEAATRALERAIDEARAPGGRLVVIAVQELPLDPSGPRNFGTFDDGPISLEPPLSPDVTDALAEARATIEASGLDADYVWATGDPARAIVDLARDRNARLVVIGEHHHHFFERLFDLSVEHAVEREAGCDVVVVR